MDVKPSGPVVGAPALHSVSYTPNLEERVNKFMTLQLPGQPQMMHMGTSYLVQDLWEEVKRLRAELAPKEYVAPTLTINP